MEDLTRAGYDYTQPTAGDYIMAINETLGFKEKIRIVSFTSEYDITGQLVKHEVLVMILVLLKNYRQVIRSQKSKHRMHQILLHKQ